MGRTRIVFDLGPQILDMQVDRTLITFVAYALYDVEQVEAGENAAILSRAKNTETDLAAARARGQRIPSVGGLL